MKAERDLQQKKKEHFREVSDRLTAASHVQIEYFAKHTKIEGYYESQMAGHRREDFSRMRRSSRSMSRDTGFAEK